MGLYEILPDDIKEVDVIVAGGGTAGCVVASRLADADPSMSILVIERGPNNFNAPNVTNPLMCMFGLAPEGKTNLFYEGNEEPHLNGRRLVVPTGNILGGGSSTNLMTYSRAQRSDWDSWKVPGWSADEMIPYLQKLETFHGKGSDDIHGYDGPINVSGGRFRELQSEQDFIQAFEKVGIPEVEDLTNLEVSNGVTRTLKYIGTDGLRQDAAHRYLHPRLQSGNFPNLHVIVNSPIKRVLFDEKKQASGVEYMPDPEKHPDAVIRTVNARKMVIVASGAMGSPSILERSGVGNPEILRNAGIDVVENLSGVGENYQDHHLMLYFYHSSLGDRQTMDAVIQGRMDLADMFKNDDPLISWNAMDTAYKIRPTDEEAAALGPEFQQVWDKFYKKDKTLPMVLGSSANVFPGMPPEGPGGTHLALSIFTGYPYSRGSLHISGPEIGSRPDLLTGYFSDPERVDIKKHVWAYKKQREVMRRMDAYRGELAFAHPKFVSGSAAVCAKLESNLLTDGEIQDIVYSAEDDKAIEEFLREQVSTTWHSLGTCKMGPREDGGVVDSTLSVYGVKKLKVADLSIPPRNVAANTNNTALAIGEKAAAIFIKELGLA